MRINRPAGGGGTRLILEGLRWYRLWNIGGARVMLLFLHQEDKLLGKKAIVCSLENEIR
jgi:hypothetical protein